MTSSRYHSDSSHPGLDELRRSIEEVRNRIVAHPVYYALTSIDAAVVFMKHHVFAVWDFMSLLKSLQRKLTYIDVPWVPQGPLTSRRLINEIVLVEESDETSNGYMSHFELYVQGMSEAGANTLPIKNFIERLRAGERVTDALRVAAVLRPASDFVAATWDIIESAPIYCQASAFAFGREDLIPEMFRQVIKIDDRNSTLAVFKDYLARHIEVDGEQHTPMAMQMLIDLCGDDHGKWAECAATVQATLEARCALWDGILAAID